MKVSKRRSFLSGASILSLSAIAVKIIGLLYRIPLLRYLGTEGMGYFNAAYELYALFCVIATAGLPVAMSVLISAHGADGGSVTSHARRVFRVSRGAFLAIGLVGTALMWGMSVPFAVLLGNERAAVCMRAISPTVLLICLSSALRGYFQGQRNMVPTAVSQVVEAAGKLLFGLVLASWARSRGCDLPTTAAWAVMGLVMGTALSLCYLSISKRCRDRRLSHDVLTVCDAPTSRTILRRLAATAVPVTMSAGLIAAAKCIDLILIHRRLAVLGFSASQIASMYGCYSTLAVPLFNILPSLSASVALSAVPALAAAFGRGGAGEAETRRTATSALRVTIAVAVPAALGLAVFSKDILSLLFSGQPTAVAEAAPWLSCLALSVPAACLVTVTGGMLQASGHAGRPMIAMLAGVGVKTVLAYILLGNARIGMMGAPVSSLICDTVIVIVNIISLSRLAPAMLPIRRDAWRMFAIPTALSILSVTAVLALRHVVGHRTDSPLGTLTMVGTVMCFYGAGWVLIDLPKMKTARTRAEDIERRHTHESSLQN